MAGGDIKTYEITAKVNLEQVQLNASYEKKSHQFFKFSYLLRRGKDLKENL